MEQDLNSYQEMFLSNNLNLYFNLILILNESCKIKHKYTKKSI